MTARIDKGTAAGHVPVLLEEVLAALAPRDGAIYVDGTFGAGGYSAGLLERAECSVLAFDCDPAAIGAGRALADRYADRLTLIEGHFGAMDELLHTRQVKAVDGVALDLGVSSMQIDDAARGFSFQADGPLDMRMDQSGPSAADVVNTDSEAQLADIIWRLGEERRARRVARAIVEARHEAPITRTKALARIVSRVVKGRPGGIHPATRTFQALRIHVNRELDELHEGLAAAERVLSPGGRLAVVSFHSLEDRIVKRFLGQRSGRAGRPSRHAPDVAEPRVPSFELLFRKARSASQAEIERNPRARSAKLRAATRTQAPAFPMEVAA